MARHISEILLNFENEYISEAEDWIMKAIESDKRNGMMWWHLARDMPITLNCLNAKVIYRKPKRI